jgi:thiol-disulfide isomerase/thioredoxin
MRRGIDEDEDGTIDRWAAISAEEVSAEVIGATAQRDPARFGRLLITEEELSSLGLGAAKLEKLTQRVRDARNQFEAWAAGQNVVTRSSKWTNFGADKPGVVPAGTEGSEQDVVVYENVVALFEDQEEAKQLLVGTMVQVDNRWRLVDLPRAVTDGAVLNEEGMFFTATFSSRGNAGSSAATSGVSKVLVRLVGELQDVDAELLSGNAGDMERLHDERATILEKLVAETSDANERANWIRQLADTVNAAAQAGEYKGGVDRLESFARRLASSGAEENDVAYVVYRSLEARHQQASAAAKETDWEEVQDAHVKRLAKFATEYPESPEAADAMINIALSAELAGDATEASKWYRQAATLLGDSLAGRKAAGALRRLNLEGQPISFTGTRVDGGRFEAGAYRGGPVIYHCWANWSTQSKSEMAVLKQIAAKYAKDGVRVVGINFDVSPADQQARDAFLRSGGYTWPQIAETDGLDGPFAVNYGVLSLPLNIVVGKDGRVAKVGLFSLEIDSLLEEMLDK